MRELILAALMICAPTMAMAATVEVASDAPYAVAVETLATTKPTGKKGLMWDGFSVGGYDLYTTLTATGRAGGFMLNKIKYNVSVGYRFTRSDQTALLNGTCQISPKNANFISALSVKPLRAGFMAARSKAKPPPTMRLRLHNHRSARPA